MSEWSFSYKFGDTELLVCSSEEICPRVVETFVNFLRGAGFSDSVVSDSLEQVMEEHFIK